MLVKNDLKFNNPSANWRKFIKEEKGASLIESLFALALVGVIIGALMNLSVHSLQMALINRTYGSLGQHANLITEEMVKDFTLNGELETDCSEMVAPCVHQAGYSQHYCESSSVGLQIDDFLTEFEPEGICVVGGDAANGFTVELSATLYDREIKSTRTVTLQ